MTLLATLALLAVAPVGPEGAGDVTRVAVLEFQASWSNRCGSALWQKDPRTREECDALGLFADEARGGVLAALRPPEYLVMTRENTAEFLREMGGQCTEGACEVETARLIGAGLVLSGDLSTLEGAWIATLRLHDVKTAALVETGKVEGRTRLEALRKVRREAERMARDGTAPVPLEERLRKFGRRPPRAGTWDVAVRSGLMRHGGKVYSALPMDEASTWMIPVRVEASLRVLPWLLFGGHFEVGGGGASAARRFDSSQRNVLGVQVQAQGPWSLTWVPWVEGTFGYAQFMVNLGDRLWAEGTEWGFGAGIDYVVDRRRSVGAWAGVTAGSFSWISPVDAAGRQSLVLDEGARHHSAVGGLRFRWTLR